MIAPGRARWRDVNDGVSFCIRGRRLCPATAAWRVAAALLYQRAMARALLPAWLAAGSSL
jgi:hypothetical protein